MLAALVVAFLPQIAAAQNASALNQRLLAAHNAERRDLGMPGLAWSEQLAAEARSWADNLARRNLLQHSDYRERRGAGENLWMGTAGAYSPEVMIGAFIAERRLFQPGRFPQVSRTGNWADVGHYTQLIWRDTREVGCAVAQGGGNEVLVCRYWPAGNVIDRAVP